MELENTLMSSNFTIILDTNFIRETSLEILQKMQKNSRLITIKEVEKELPKQARGKFKSSGIEVVCLGAGEYVVLEKIFNNSSAIKLMNYYSNKGMADPLLLAYIVHNKTSGDKQLSMFDKPLELATRDKTLRTCCKELGIELYEDKKQLT